MSDNSKGRAELERIYGKGCMFKKAQIAERIQAMGGIKTYRRFLNETRYTTKKINQLERVMTYHHLQHRSEGGRTSERNGSVVNELAHRYLHSLPREHEELINNMLRQYKYQIVNNIIVPLDDERILVDGEPLVITPEDFSLDEGYISIPLEEPKKKVKYSRSKMKRETTDAVDEYYSMMEDVISDEPVKEFKPSKEVKQEGTPFTDPLDFTLRRLRNSLKGQAMMCKDATYMSAEERLAEMNAIGDVLHYIEEYKENIKILERFKRQKEQSNER